MADLALHLAAARSFLEQIQGTPAVADVLAQQKVFFERALSTASLSLRDAEDVCASLRAMPWDQATLTSLLSLVATRTLQCSQGASSVCRSKQQDFTSLKEYFSAQQWQILTSPTTAADTKLEIIIGQATKLGLRYFSEPSAQAITALYLTVSQGLGDSVGLLPSVKYATNQMTKKLLRKHSNCPVSTWILTLDREPRNFQAKYPQLYRRIFASSGPTNCPYDPIQLEQLTTSIPMRNTNRSMASASTSSGLPETSMGMMQSIMLGIQQMVQQQQLPPASIPITFLTPKPVGAASIANASASQLSLADKSAELEPGKSAELEPGKSSEPEPDKSAELEPGKLTGKSGKKPKLSIEASHRLIESQMAKRDSAKPKAKAKAKSKGTGKGKGKGKGKGSKVSKDTSKAVEAAKTKKNKLPCIGTEWSRNQIMCRGIDGHCTAIKFAKDGHEKAMKQAAKWLAAERKKLEK